MTPIAVTIAGSDSSGGAGIQADLKTFSALGVYGASVITALTAQNTQGVQDVLAVPANFVSAQIDSVFADLAVGAVKIGMLAAPDIIAAVRAGLDRHAAENVVVDPVMIAASGDPLVEPEAVAAIRDMLLPRADIVTPNLPEAAALLGEDEAQTPETMEAQAARLIGLGARAVVLKGGHGTGAQAIDVFHDGAGVRRFASPRIDTRNTHGTGCTLSSAIASGLARGEGLHAAVERAKSYVSGAIAAADRLSIGSGHGPVHHFHLIWPDED